MPDVNLHNIAASFVFPGVASVAWYIGAWVVGRVFRKVP
jgi:hypothetical protein